MKLVAEQIKELRERRKELQDKKVEYIRFCQNRETAGVDGIGAPHYLDYQEDYDMNSAQQELREIDHLLEQGEFLFDRPLQEIGIGTKFMLDFGDGELDKTMLVERGTFTGRGSIYASIESDLGKAVIAQKEDEIKKGQSTFIKRLIAAAFVFFVVVIVKLLVSLLADNSGAGISGCIDEVLNCQSMTKC